METFVIFGKNNLKINILKIKNIVKTGTIAIIQSIKEYRGASHSICSFKYSVPNVIPTVFRNGSNYDYRFIIKELAKEFKKQFTCLGENTKKYITFSVPIQKEVNKNR